MAENESNLVKLRAAPADWAGAIAASGAKWRVSTYNAKFRTENNLVLGRTADVGL